MEQSGYFHLSFYQIYNGFDLFLNAKLNIEGKQMLWHKKLRGWPTEYLKRVNKCSLTLLPHLNWGLKIGICICSRSGHSRFPRIVQNLFQTWKWVFKSIHWFKGSIKPDSMHCAGGLTFLSNPQYSSNWTWLGESQTCNDIFLEEK